MASGLHPDWPFSFGHIRQFLCDGANLHWLAIGCVRLRLPALACVSVYNYLSFQ